MRAIGMIPARYKSTRFPGKPLADICGKPMIQWVYESAVKVKQFEAVYVATDDARIFDAVTGFGGRALMTSPDHTCGTDRLAECAKVLDLADDDVILNIQGDEPMIKPEMIEDLLGLFTCPDVYMGTLKKQIESKEELENTNVVKIITDINDDAIYFSRCCIPFIRDDACVTYYKHIGIYGYRVWFLKKFSSMKKTSLELAESLEQLRVIENGMKIRVKETRYTTVGVDTPEQLALVVQRLKAANG